MSVSRKNFLYCLLVAFFFQAVSALDFSTAVRDGKFQTISFDEQDSMQKRLLPFGSYGSSSQAYVLRGIEGKRSSGRIRFFVQDEHSDTNFKSGISLVVLKASFYGSNFNCSRIQVNMTLGSHQPENLGNIYVSYPIPDRSIPRNLIFKTWDHDWHDEHEVYRELEIEFLGLERLESVYFVVTSYRVRKSSVGSSLDCEDSIIGGKDIDWWDCNSQKSGSNLLCINYDLTCDHLPNCAASSLPNPDENCRFSAGFEEALELLLYTITILFIVIVIACIVKCVMVRLCGTRTVEASQVIREYLRSGSIDRPLNSPPTYDDAMKDVNEAFNYGDEDDLPPVYTPEPQQGEEVCNPFTYEASSQPSNSQAGPSNVLDFNGRLPPLEPVVQSRWLHFKSPEDSIDPRCGSHEHLDARYGAHRTVQEEFNARHAVHEEVDTCHVVFEDDDLNCMDSTYTEGEHESDRLPTLQHRPESNRLPILQRLPDSNRLPVLEHLPADPPAYGELDQRRHCTC